MKNVEEAEFYPRLVPITKKELPESAELISGTEIAIIVSRDKERNLLQHLEDLGWKWASGLNPTDLLHANPMIDFDAYCFYLRADNRMFFSDTPPLFDVDVTCCYLYTEKVVDNREGNFCNNPSHSGTKTYCGIGSNGDYFLYCPVCKLEKC